MKGYADFMLEIIQVIAKVMGAISSTGPFALRLVEYFKHKKTTGPTKDKVAFFSNQ